MANTYKMTETGEVIEVATGRIIPVDNGNRDRQAFNAWLAAGNTPDPADIKEPPVVVASHLLRLVLNSDGKLENVNALVAASGDKEAMILWGGGDYGSGAQFFDSTHPKVLMIGAALGMDKAAVHALFVRARDLTV